MDPTIGPALQTSINRVKYPSVNLNNSGNQPPQQPTGTPNTPQTTVLGNGTQSTNGTVSVSPSATPQQISALGQPNNTPVLGSGNSGLGANGQPVSATNPPTPKTEGDLFSEALNNSQGLIDSIKTTTDAQLEQQNQANQAAQKDTEYAAAAGGFMGTPGGGAAIRDTAQKGATANNAISAQGGQQIQTILKTIADTAQTTALAQTQQGFENAGTAESNKTTIATNQANAQGIFKSLAAIPGFNYDAFKQSPYYQQLLQQSGMDSSSADLYFNSLKPLAQQVQWQAPVTQADGSTLLYGLDPVTGKLVTQTFGGAPTGSSLVMQNGLPFYQQQNPDGTPNAQGILIPAPLSPSQKNASEQEYQFYVGQQLNAGQTPLNFFDWQVSTKTAAGQLSQSGSVPTSTNPFPANNPPDDSVGGSAFAKIVADPTSSASVNNLIGLEGTDGKFIPYPDLQTGIDSGISSVTDRISKLTAANPNATIMDLSKSWAGSGNNNVPGWANDVASTLGVPVNTKLSDLDPTQAFYAMAKKESNYDPTTSFNVNDESKPPTGTAGNAPISSIGGKSPNALWQDSIKYATQGGNIQQFTGGLSSKPAQQAYKNAVQNKSAALATAAGVDETTLQQEWTANSGAINQQVTNLNNVQRALDGADQTGQQIMSAFSSSGISPTDSKWANATLNDIKKNITGGKIQAYSAGIAELANEYSQVFSRGGQNSVQSHYNAQDVVNGNIKLSDLQGVLDELQSAGKIVMSTNIDQIKNVAGGKGTDAVAQFLSYVHGVPMSSDNSQSGGSSGGGDYQAYLKAIQ